MQSLSHTACENVDIDYLQGMKTHRWGFNTKQNSTPKDINTPIKAQVLSPGSAKACRQKINKSKLKVRAPC